MEHHLQSGPELGRIGSKQVLEDRSGLANTILSRVFAGEAGCVKLEKELLYRLLVHTSAGLQESTSERGGVRQLYRLEPPVSSQRKPAPQPGEFGGVQHGLPFIFPCPQAIDTKSCTLTSSLSGGCARGLQLAQYMSFQLATIRKPRICSK